ncbi:hypothetical protein [Leadbetterella sp. DM7]|uniref:hypothetical protein n=1 Tax=Leadbetterella sp. DM7 TaxID=3235085 RepID=UPI00349E5DB8
MKEVMPKERLQALGLGLTATPKSIYKFLVDKNAGISIYLDYKVSSMGVINKLSPPKRY